MPTLSGSDLSQLYSQSGVARSGATRMADHSAKVFVKINGTQRAFNRPSETSQVLMDSLKVNEANGSEPNRASMSVMGFTPTRFEEVVITLGSVNRLKREFGGVILKTAQRFVAKPAHVAYDLSCIDYGWQLNALVTGHFTGTYDEVAIELIETYAPGFSTEKIQRGLGPVTGGISFTNVRLRQALDRLAVRGGITWRPDYRKRILFGTTDYLWLTNPQPLTASNRTFLFDPDAFSVERDRSQQLTRVHCEGGGATALVEVAVGADRIPVTAALVEWYGDAGGEAIIGDTQQIISYTERFNGDGGGLVGPGAAPSVRMTLTGEFGTALDDDAVYGYAYTFVTASGESLPSPIAQILTGEPVPQPSAAYSVTAQNGTPIFGTGVYVYGISWEFPGGLRSGIGSLEQVVTNAAATAQINLSGLPQPGDPEATHINIWRSTLSGYTGIASLKLVTTVVDGTTTYADTTLDGALGAAAHTTATAVRREVRITNIPAGPSGTISRKGYRTEGNGAQLKLLMILPDNVTDTFEDDIADGSLGANAPLTDTSGLSLTPPTGMVAAGATSIPVTGSFPETGWVLAGNQVIRYGSRTVTTLDDVPASGVGSLQAPLNYNTTITPAPQLIGIPPSGPGAIVNTIPNGATVNLWVTVDNLAAQAEIAALLDPTDTMNGLAGIIADVLSDTRISRDEAIARATAHLDSQDDEQVTIAFTTWDKNAHGGHTQVANIAAPTSVSETLKIQDVEIAWTDANPPIFPIRTVTASTKRFTFEALLRQARENM